MKVAIHQPNFLPWLGYFNKIKESDLFVFLDDVQFERGKTFTSRSKIIANNQELWLTIPTKNKSELKNINEIEVDNPLLWKKKHLKTIEMNFKKSVYFNSVYSLIEQVYMQDSTLLIDYNIPLITSIANSLNLETKFINSSSLQESHDKQAWEKILSILKETNTKTYISGSGEGSKRYVNQSDLTANGINLKWQEFNHPTYPQLHGEFISHLSIIDALFNVGFEGVKKII